MEKPILVGFMGEPWVPEEVRGVLGENGRRRERESLRGVMAVGGKWGLTTEEVFHMR